MGFIVPPFFKGGLFFTIITILGVVVGIGLGLGLRTREEPWSPREVMYLKFPGELFLRTLGALILPLIFSSLIDAIGSMDLSLSKKIGVRALVYYLGTTAVAAILGLILAVIVKPGSHSDSLLDCPAQNSSTVDTLLDLVRNIFPPNLIGATLEVSKTIVTDEDADLDFNMRKPVVTMEPGTNMMGLVIFAMVLGVTLSRMGEAGKILLLFFKSLGEATMEITTVVVKTSPIAICFLVAGQLVGEEDIGGVFKNIGWYFGTVMGGLIIHGLIILPGLFILLTRKSPLGFMGNMFNAIATAFGTASSSSTLPITLECLEQKNKVDPRVSRFVIPIGATVNMNGTAIYLPIGCIYVAQLCGRTLGIGELITVSLISIATSIGAAGIPQVGMVIMLTVLGSVGLPVAYISYIMPIDWLLERFRTAVNVLGDAIGAGVVDHMSKNDLHKIDQLSEWNELQNVAVDVNSTIIVDNNNKPEEEDLSLLKITS